MGTYTVDQYMAKNGKRIVDFALQKFGTDGPTMVSIAKDSAYRRYSIDPDAVPLPTISEELKEIISLEALLDLMTSYQSELESSSRGAVKSLKASADGLPQVEFFDILKLRREFCTALKDRLSLLQRQAGFMPYLERDFEMPFIFQRAPDEMDELEGI